MAYCKMRKLPLEAQNLMLCDRIDRVRQLGYIKGAFMIGIRYQGQFSSSETEIAPPDNVFDGTSTPAKVYVVSDNASDTQDLTLLGLDENDNITTETITLTGTTAVQSSTKWKRIFHAYVITNATGTITVQDDAAGTTIYLTIAATHQESNGAAFWVPSGYAVFVSRSDLVMTTKAGTNSTLDVNVYYTGFGGGDNPDLDFEHIRVGNTGNKDMEKPTCVWISEGESYSKVTLKEYYSNTAETGLFQINFVILPTTAFGGG